MHITSHEHMKVVHLLDPASYGAAAEAYSSDLDTLGYRECQIVVQCGAFTATGDVSFAVYEGAAASPTTAISGATIAEKVQAGDQKTYVGHINLDGRARYLRVGYDVDDDNCIFGILAILSNPVTLPTSPENTLAFNV